MDLGLVLRRGAGEYVEQVAEAVHQCGELAARHAPAPLAGRPAKLDLGGEALGLDLADPGADDRRVGIYNKTVMKALQGLLNKRNESAHPSDYFPDMNETLGYMSEIFQRVERLKI